MIEAENLQLIPCGPSLLATVLNGKKGLEPLLAFSRPEVAAVKAETLRGEHGSIRVLEKLGMRFAGGTYGVLRWRLDRQDFREGGAP
ncbi:MAG: hypothetical protein AVDCRST_MAG02-3414 [uncultured Rubrobacteraceae bacterium]|uniref:Uncharacterized protein n=1 Tax=uncultured Rubrobacteraceae bacterium TaxID=349277 RepID=A0A6J4RGX8_9ACTN|nr:MAG: hypothetical protein AVDCRST_MAG02-3414 [uncultured Rubrobacteraceae bacterium]